MTPPIPTPDPRWQSCSGKRCRYTHCDNPAVAEFERSHGSQVRFWPYCLRHVEAYGHVIVAGVVMKRTEAECDNPVSLAHDS